jgi:hypothetical protein
MQLFPLPTDGRVSVVVTAPLLPPGPLRVALRVDGGDVVIDALGPDGPRRVGHLAAADAAAHRPAVVRLAARGQVGTCPAQMIRSGGTATLVLHLGSSASCAPQEGRRGSPDAVPRPEHTLATARTTRLRSAVPAARGARPHRPCPSRPGTVPRPRSRVAPGHDDRHPVEPVTPRRSSLPARPPLRFGQPDDVAPRLTRDQRLRVLLATVGVAAALLLASVLQHTGSAGPAADTAGACADGSSACRP